MKNYSIIRVGNDYVVRADEKSILKVASRRRAAQLVTEASGLMTSDEAPDAPPAQPVIGDEIA
jgi:hypothetical protein